ncbi:MAG TPA: ScyD/ScyE family protein [Micromonosporaceae bacterium]
MRFKLHVAVASVALVGAAFGSAPPAAAHDPQHHHHGKHHHAKLTVIARGLDNPRGLAIGPDGVVLVTEAGRGGSGPCLPGSAGEQLCLGATGAITAIWKGHQHRIATGLPSLSNESKTDVLGPHDLVLSRGGLFVSIGLGANPANRPLLGAAGQLTGQIVRLKPSGKVSAFADLAAYELANNPDQGQPGTAVDSNPYGLLAHPKGGVVATDAGGNDLLRVDKKGHISLLAVFPVTPTPAPDGTVVPMQFVPTTVVRGPDGAYYVGQLTGFPFPVGGAKVWRIVPGHAPTVYASGFTNIIDIAFDHHGRLLVLEMFKNGLLSNDPTGALIRVERNGSHTELASTGLVTPSSVAVGSDGCIYIANKGTLVGQGEVLRLSPHH